MYAIFGIIAVLLVVVVAMGVSFVSLGVWGVTKLIQGVSHKLLGKGKLTDDAPSPPEMPSGTQGASPRIRVKPQDEPGVRANYEYFDVDAGTTVDRIRQVMETYRWDSVVGTYATAVLDALQAAEFRRRTLFSEIDAKFVRGSMSWERFATTANAALDAVLRNCALLANRVQAFDTADYRRLEEYYRAGGMHDESRLQRWRLLQGSREEMEGIRTANEGLLLELGKLAAELGKLSSSESTDESSRIAEEVSRLVDETKYYR